MLILSQDKNTIINLNQITGLSVCGNGEIHALRDTPGNQLVLLGGYSRERCGVILEEILQHYEESLESHIATDYAARVDRPYIYAKNTVYRMPEH